MDVSQLNPFTTLSLLEAFTVTPTRPFGKVFVEGK